MIHTLIVGEAAGGGFIVAGILVGMVFIAGILGTGTALVIKVIRRRKKKKDDV